MNRYAIAGADKKTGLDVKIEVTAQDETQARQVALAEGILITECKLLGEKPAPANRSEAYLREIALWLRFFGILVLLGIAWCILYALMWK